MITKFSEKGFVYIIVVMITIGLISLMIIISTGINREENITEDLFNNYLTELSRISVSNKDETSIKKFQESFITFMKAHNHNIQLCSIFADDDYYYISNYLGKDCKLYVDGVDKGLIYNNSTIKTDIFINDTNIYLCNCEYKNYDVFYINIYDSKSRIIYNNMR